MLKSPVHDGPHQNRHGRRGMLFGLALLCLGLAPNFALADHAADLGLDLPKRGVPDRANVVRKNIPPNTRVTVAELDGPGCIQHLFLALKDPRKSPGSNRKIALRIYFDGSETPHVEAPVGDFFGVMHERDYYDINSVFLAVKAWSGYNAYFPMPFARSARIEFETGPEENTIVMQADWTRYPGQEMKEPQRFCARWRRENPTERYGRNFLMLDADGPGRLLGFVYGVRLFDNTDRWSHGGADNIYIDGEGDHPAYIRGLGGEDTFGSGYGGALHPPESHLYNGLPYYTHEDIGEARPAQRVVGYRFYMQDPIRFEKSIHMRFGCMENDICATVYWYQTGAPRQYVKLPEWSKIPLAATVKPEDVDLPLPETGRWLVDGIYPNEEKSLKELLPPEVSSDSVKWRPIDALHGFVDFNLRFRPTHRGVAVVHDRAVAVARTTIDAPADMKARFHLTWDDHLVLRVNEGESLDCGEQQSFRSRTVEVPLRKGANTVTVKLSNTAGYNHGGWLFAFRATAPDGKVLIPMVDQ